MTISLKQEVTLKHEPVEMAAGGLYYYIMKKLITKYLRDMAQLADGVRHVECLKAEKARVNKCKKERVAYVDMEDSDLMSDVKYDHIKESEVDVAELKPSPSYACKMLTPRNGKTPYELEKNHKFPKKTYTFSVTKCVEVFDLLVLDGQLLVPPGAKVSPLQQRKKRGFCKYHDFLGHKTSQCLLFKDLGQNALDNKRPKFAKGKSPIKIDSDPLQVGEGNVAKPVGINMVEIIDFNMEEKDGDFESNEIEDIYPKAGEGFLEFLN